MKLTFEAHFSGLTVALVENSSLEAQMVKRYLEDLGCEVIWIADSVEAAEACMETSLPDVAFIDLRLDERGSDYKSGWQVAVELQRRKPDIATIILSATPPVEDIMIDLLRHRCSYLIKEDLGGVERELLTGALLAAYSRSVLLSSMVARDITDIVTGPASKALTDQEMKVLELAADGHTNKEIASKLYISENTVKTHMSSIFSKLGVSNRAGAVARYLQGI